MNTIMRNTMIILGLLAMACTRTVDMTYDIKCVECAVAYTDDEGEERITVVRASWVHHMEVERRTDLTLEAVSMVPDSGVGQGYVVARILSGAREVAAGETYDPFGVVKVEAVAK